MANVGLVGTEHSSNITDLINKGHNVSLLLDYNSQNSFINTYAKKIGIKVYLIDFTSKKSIITSLNKHKNLNNLEVLISTYERYILAKAIIGEKLSLNTLSVDSALNVTDKYLQRQKYKELYPEITPDFKVVVDMESIDEFMQNHEFPVIIKPTNLLKSLLVSKCYNMEELKEYFNTAKNKIKTIYKRERIKRKPRFIIEEFLQGSAHSVEVFSDSKRNYPTPVVDIVKALDMGKDDVYEYKRELPSNESKAKIKELQRAAIKAVKAIGLTNSPAHVELIYTSKGPKIIEVNGRVGGYRNRMYNYSYGLELLNSEIDLILGKKLNFKPVEKSYTSVYEIFPNEEGYFLDISNKKDLKKLNSLKSFSIKRKMGEKIGKAKSGYRACATIILSNSNLEQFEKDKQFIEEKVSVDLDKA